MNEAQRQAIQTAIFNAEDNLYRAQLQKRAMPEWVSGNGVSIDDMIAGYQATIDKLKEGLD